MNQDNNNIDAFFRSRLSEYEVSPPPGGFDAISSRLNDSNKKRISWWWSMVAACLLVLLALPFIINQSENEVEIPLATEMPVPPTIEIEASEKFEVEVDVIQLPVEKQEATSAIAYENLRASQEIISDRRSLEERMQADIDELVQLERTIAIQQAKYNSMSMLDDYLVAVSEELSSQLELQARIEESFLESGFIVQQYQRNHRIPDVGRVLQWENLRQIDLSDIPIINRVFTRETKKEVSEE